MISPLTRVAKAGDTAQVTTNTTDVAANTAQTAANSASIVGVLAAVAATSGTVASLDTRVSATEATGTNNATNIGSLNSAIGQKAAQTTVTALQATVTGLPTLSEVTTVADSRNLAQDSVIAGTYATQAQLAALPAGASATVQANIVSGAQALASVNVTGNAIVGGSLQSGNFTSTGSYLGGSWLSLDGIPSNPSPATVYCQNLSAGSGNGSVSCLALSCLGAIQGATVSTTGNVVCGANMILGNSIYLYGINGIISCASLTQSSPTAGTVLKQTMEACGWGSVSIAPGNVATVKSFSYTPLAASTDLHLTLSGHKCVVGGSGSDGAYYAPMLYIGSSLLAFSSHLYSGAFPREQSRLDYPLVAVFSNTGTSSLTIEIRAQVDQNSNTDDSLTFVGGNNTYLQITEVAR